MFFGAFVVMVSKRNLVMMGVGVDSKDGLDLLFFVKWRV